MNEGKRKIRAEMNRLFAARRMEKERAAENKKKKVRYNNDVARNHKVSGGAPLPRSQFQINVTLRRKTKNAAMDMRRDYGEAVYEVLSESHDERASLRELGLA